MTPEQFWNSTMNEMLIYLVPSYDDIVGREDSPAASNTHTGWEDSKAFMKALQNRRSKNDNGSA